ncbi:hypothetical protein LPJ56_001688, partial [Coemansia sp. RSA 2599]
MEDSRGIPKCRDSQSETPTAAERLAMEAAKDAGWRIHWPRIRMMSQSPDLAQAGMDADGAQADHHRQQPVRQGNGANSGSGTSGPGAWTQLMRFVAEITEVFGSPLFGAAVSEEDVDVSADSDDSFVELPPLDGHGSAEASETLGSCKSSFVGSEDDSESRGRLPGQTLGGPTSTASLVLHAQRSSAEDFARRHPLAVLFLSWLAMVAIDWMVTSAAVPRLLSLVTLRPWSPFSESFVLRASLVSADPTRSGLWQAIRSHLASGELWIDDSLWRMQTLVTMALVPLTRPYALQWLVFCALSVHALKRYSRLGARAMALCVLYFALADLSLWRVFAPSSARLSDIGLPDMGAAAYTSPSYECLSDACRVSAARATPPPQPQPPSLSSSLLLSSGAAGSADYDSVSTSLDGVVFPYSVRSPFADAVEDALAQKQAMLERRSERMRGLQDWRKLYNSTQASGNSRTLSTLATLSVYSYAGFRLRQPGIQTLRLAMLLFVLDVVGRYWIRWYWINVAEPCCRSASARLSSTGLGQSLADWTPRDTFYRELASARGVRLATVVGYLQHSMHGLLRSAGCFLSRASDHDAKSAASQITGMSVPDSASLSASASALASAWGLLLPIHVLSIFLLVCFREAAFAVHNMRVWYKTVVRDRRRGPAMISGKSAALSTRGVSVTTSNGEATNSHSGSVAGAAESRPATQCSSTIRSVLSSAGASGVYAHRVCFVCLSGYCERCLLSMEIWPTAFASGRGIGGSAGAVYSHGDSMGLLGSCCENCSGHSGAAHASAGSVSVPGSSSSVGGTKRKARGHGSAGARQQQGLQPNAAAVVCDPLLEESGNGLPSLRDSLLNLGLLNPSLNAPMSSTSFAGTMQINAGASGKRSKTLDAWIVSSVAHCPCRTVHGVGPSSFVPKAIRAERAERICQQQQQQISAGGFEPPVGTLLPLAQYVRELKSLGLVRPVDPSSVVSNEDPTASVFPMIFGRFTMPENPQAVAAANALLASSAASYAQLTQPSGHTPGGAPFLGASSSLPPSSASCSSAPSAGASRPSRILVKPTPLSNVRAPGGSTFRLRIEDIQASDGSVVVSVSMTPVLAHLLLAHQRTASSASVCVPASLASSIASRSRMPLSPTTSALSGSSPGPSFTSATSAPALTGAPSGTSTCASVQKRSNSDVDPFLDYVRVLLPKSDAVLRVDGARWAEVEFQGCLNQPILVRGLLRDHVYSICLTICGMRSEELLVCLPSVSIGAAAAKERTAKWAEIEVLQGSLEDYRSRIQAAIQLLRKTKKEGPKQLHNCANDLAVARKSLERLVHEGPKMERRVAQLSENLAGLDAEIPALREQLDEIRQELTQINMSATADADDADAESGTQSDSGSGSISGARAPVPKPLKKYASAGSNGLSNLSSGFGVLPILNDSGESRSHSTSPVDAFAENMPNSQHSLAVDQALKRLRATEAKYRRAQDEREEVIQELKAERARWMGTLAQVTQSIEPIERSIDPVRRDLKDVTKRANASKALESKLVKQLEKQTPSGSFPVSHFEEKGELDKRVSELKSAIKEEETK